MIEFRSLYPVFQLEDELFVQAGRDAMHGKAYAQHRRKDQGVTLTTVVCLSDIELISLLL